MTHHLTADRPAWMSPAADALRQRAGRILLALMLVMAAVGAAVVPLLADLIAAVAGILALHMVLTALMMARPKPVRAGSAKLLEAA